MINSKSIAMMKTEVKIINTARGALVVGEDLHQALDDGKVGMAALDVVGAKPILPDNQLLKAKNCIITPISLGHL